MELYSMIRGKKIPEVYHFGFNGTHFQTFIPFVYWSRFVDMFCRFRDHQKYVPLLISGGVFGQQGCANATKMPDGSIRIEISAFGDEGQKVFLRDLGQTLSGVLRVLKYLLAEEDEQKEEITQGISQLFVLNTFVSLELGFHSAGMEMTTSPLSRRYFEGLGENIILDEARNAMRAHMLRMFPSREGSSLLHSYPRITLRERGVLDLATEGNCACFGTAPRDFGENEGYHLTSHNIDYISQQFNLLVGVASVWQMVRNGLVEQSKIT